MNAFKLNDDAIKFFKNSGLEKSREVIKMSSHALVDCGDGSYFHINQLKQIVDAFELVETGLPELKKAMFSNSKDLDYVKNWILTVSDKLLTEEGARLKQAINLVEQCNA